MISVVCCEKIDVRMRVTLSGKWGGKKHGFQHTSDTSTFWIT